MCCHQQLRWRRQRCRILDSSTKMFSLLNIVISTNSLHNLFDCFPFDCVQIETLPKRLSKYFFLSCSSSLWIWIASHSNFVFKSKRKVFQHFAVHEFGWKTKRVSFAYGLMSAVRFPINSDGDFSHADKKTRENSILKTSTSRWERKFHFINFTLRSLNQRKLSHYDPKFQ